MHRGGEQLLVVLFRQVIRQQANRGQRYRAIGKSVEERWELPRRASGLDSSVSGVLGEMQTPRAVGEERRVTLLEVYATDVHLGEQREQLSRRAALAASSRLDVVKQLLV